MAKERLKSPRVRLFAALDLPDDVREGLVRWGGTELADTALRPVAPEALHVTLCFLGYRPERDVDRVGEAIGSLEPRPVELRLEPDPKAVPHRRPRLVAIDAPSEAATSIQAELSGQLEAGGLYRPEKRPFWPHVTVARVRAQRDRSGGRRRRGGPRTVERMPGRLPSALLEPFHSPRLSLYRSHLHPAGAEYERLAAQQLPAWR